MRDAFVERLSELAAEDPRICLITGDLGFGVLDDFATRFPDQYINAGVAEQNMTAIAAGMALEGHAVFTYSIGNFPTLRCLEQIRNDVCYHDANVTVVAIGGGFSYGVLGMSHHATEDLAIMRALPEMTVVSPGDLWEAGEATSQVAATPGPCYLRLDKSAAENTAQPGERFQLGRARMLRDGGDVTLIATGGILGETLGAAEDIARQGIECRVLSMHTVKPLDTRAVTDACRQTGGIVTVEEHNIVGGLGGAVAEACLDAGVQPGLFHRVGLRDVYSAVVGSQDFLRRYHGMDRAAIASIVADLLHRRPAAAGGAR